MLPGKTFLGECDDLLGRLGGLGYSPFGQEPPGGDGGSCVTHDAGELSAVIGQERDLLGDGDPAQIDHDTAPASHAHRGAAVGDDRNTRRTFASRSQVDGAGE